MEDFNPGFRAYYRYLCDSIGENVVGTVLDSLEFFRGKRDNDLYYEACDVVDENNVRAAICTFDQGCKEYRLVDCSFDGVVSSAGVGSKTFLFGRRPQDFFKKYDEFVLRAQRKVLGEIDKIGYFEIIKPENDSLEGAVSYRLGRPDVGIEVVNTGIGSVVEGRRRDVQQLVYGSGADAGVLFFNQSNGCSGPRPCGKMAKVWYKKN